MNPQYLTKSQQNKKLSAGAVAGISIAAILVVLGKLLAAILKYLKPHLFKFSKGSGQEESEAVAGHYPSAAAAMSSSGAGAGAGGGAGNGFYTAPPPSKEMAYISAAAIGTAGVIALKPPPNDKYRHRRRRKHPEAAHHHHLLPTHPSNYYANETGCPLLAAGHMCKDPLVEPLGPCVCTDRNC